MWRRSHASVLVAAALALVVVSGYVGPALCGAMHGRPAQTDHCDQPAGDAGGPLWTVPDHPVGCPDAAHCSVGFAGPVLRPTSLLVGDWAPAGPAPAPAAGLRTLFAGPPTPPPKA